MTTVPAGEEDYPFRGPIHVRFRDLDALGHVNNAVFVTYLEMGRVMYWKALGYREYGFVLARIELDYRRPIHLGDEIEVQLGLAEMGRSSFVLRYRLVDVTTGDVCGVARTVQVAYDHAAKRSVVIEEEFRRRIAEFEGTMRPRGPSF